MSLQGQSQASWKGHGDQERCLRPERKPVSVQSSKRCLQMFTSKMFTALQFLTLTECTLHKCLEFGCHLNYIVVVIDN